MIFALEEEIGSTEIFTGRKGEISYLMNWLEGVKKKCNNSIALLARRKKGKTALIQRFYNILFTMNDPMIVPFYYRIREVEKSQLQLADELYNSLLRQYAAFVTRDVSLIKKKLSYPELRELFNGDKIIVQDTVDMERWLGENNSDQAWEHASWAGERISIEKNIRIIQIFDEFQYLDRFIYTVIEGKERPLPLCGTYHHVGASKISPVIVTGSYITWLLTILRKMTGRYTKKNLRNLPMEEALEAVYKHSRFFNAPVTEESAAYIASLTEGDVFYIARIFKSDFNNKDLTSPDCINEIILHETRTSEDEMGEIADMWSEYLNDAISRINDKNGKRIVLYLAKHGKNERTRKEIMDDLQLEMTDSELEKKLDTFIKTDILTYGETRYDYRGLGDKFFEIIFREMYQKEIDSLDLETIKTDIRQQLKSAWGKVSFYKGIMTEYAVVNRLLFAVINKEPLRQLVQNYIEGYELTEFTSAAKRRFYSDQIHFTEVDIFLESKTETGNDFVIEVKNWETPVTREQVEKFIATGKALKALVKPGTGYIFFSAKPLQENLEKLLSENNIMIMYPPKTV
ncbi:MAG: hypothetical protein HQM10_12695 [Candidatus Riflebacteria bacterium]|nr:hypothetical protein [Candidatus Riflebacteria bacterium]